MSWPLAIALYFVVWWIVLFAVLPIGVRTQAEAGEVVPGTPSSAPAGFPLRKVFLINTAVATVAFCLIWLGIEIDIFGIEKIAASVNR